MSSVWIGTIALGENWGVFVGDGSVTPVHQHLAFKVVVGLDGDILVQFKQRPSLSGRVALVRPQELHAVSASGVRVGLFYVEPQALARDDGAALSDHLPVIAQAMHDFDHDGVLAPVSAVARKLTLLSRPLQRNLGRARATLAEGQYSIEHAASAVGLSESRLSHLFRQQTGVPPSRFRRWSRLRQAANYLAVGMSITDAALEAGFSDAAHLTRTFTEMLGITPGTFSASRLIIAPLEQ
ncbi:MAG: helix-turn-helix domain-containing protein [Rhodoferax sp.]|nr:helix-turn-helix domain-containing protein [Rhodoferax sp.]